MATRNARRVLNTEKHIALLIERSRKILEQKSIIYKSSWLLEGGIGSKKWITTSGTDEKTIVIDFEYMLPDGTLLTNDGNRAILEPLQKLAFELRSGLLPVNIAPKLWRKKIKWMINLAHLVILYEEEFKPKTHGFSLINENNIQIIFHDLSIGSWACALKFPDRVINFLHIKVYGTPAPEYLYEDINNLPENFISDTCDWLEKSGNYTKARSQGVGKSIVIGTFSRKLLCSFLGTHWSAFKSIPFRLFLRQFEPKIANAFLLVDSARPDSECFSHKTLTLNDASRHKVDIKSFKEHIYAFQTFFLGSTFNPNSIPKLEIQPKPLIHKFSENLAPSGHTLKIPYTIGILYLEKAIEWIMRYGDAIIDATIMFAEELEHAKKSNDGPIPTYAIEKNIEPYFEMLTSRFHTRSFDDTPAEPLTSALNITKFNAKIKRNTVDGQRCFTAVIQAFIGACVIVIALMKPMREQEVSKLKRNALSINAYKENYENESNLQLQIHSLGFDEVDAQSRFSDSGAFLTHINQKSGSHGYNSLVRRPIPYVATITIQKLQRLGDRLSAIFNDSSSHGKDLFYFPNISSFSKPTGKTTSARIDRCINYFGDMISVPLDEYGRRWYPAIHELRKFFVMTVYYHEQLNVRDALQYHMAHTSTEHLDDYLAGDPYDDEINKYQVQSIDEKLLAYELGKIPAEGNSGITKLYNSVIKHFKVSKLGASRQTEYLPFIESLLANNDIQITSYMIQLESYPGEVFETDIAIRYEGKSDAQFNN
ncbi:hypothetical protein ACYZT8_03330 [Pseudomonas sp. LB3P93]